MKLPDTFVPDSKHINVIIETPKGSGNKYTFDPKTQNNKVFKPLRNKGKGTAIRLIKKQLTDE